MVKNLPANAGDGSSIPGSEGPWRRKWQPSAVFLPGTFPWAEELAGFSPWVAQSQT